jgi:hypothetical protein
LGGVKNQVMLEMGTRSGNYPIATIQLSSYLAEFLQNSGESLGAEDESSFPMQLLHFRRTLIETAYQQQCSNLCYGQYPSWEEVSDTFERLRSKL